jgi:triosephosphate isomerase
MNKRKIKAPFLIINPKSYIYGKESLELAKVADQLAKEYNIDVMFTAQLVDIPAIVQHTSQLIVTAQHMDGIVPGRGMGHVLPEALKHAGVAAVVLNHAERPLTLANLDKAMRRADELGIITIVCADSVAQCKAVAQLKPDVIICEPTSLIGTGHTSDDSYILETNEVVKAIDSSILIIQAAGVSTGDDVYRVITQGADGSGGTSGILNAPNRKEKILEMIKALKRTEKERIELS